MANKIYRAVQPAKVFTDSADYPMALRSLGAGAGRSSVILDRGANSVPIRYKWRAVITWAVTGILWETAEIYVSESNGTLHDSNWTANAALTEGSFENSTFLGSVFCQMTTPESASIVSGTCILSSRYVMVGVWNRSTTKTLNATSNASRIILTAMPDEIQ